VAGVRSIAGIAGIAGIVDIERMIEMMRPYSIIQTSHVVCQQI
jgi:hypothetical protein